MQEPIVSDTERKQWLDQERFFARSWTHVFYLWKLYQVTIGKTMRKILLGRPGDRRRVLDLGCGPGTSLFEVSDVCADIPGVQWCGLDLNVREVTLAARRSRFRVAERGRRPIRFLVGDLRRVPLADGSMDLVLSSEVVEHLPDPRPAIAEMARILKPGSYALLTTPNPNNLPERVGYVLDKLTGGAVKRMFWKGHDEVSAPALTAEVGFGHVSVRPYRTWHSWLEEAGLNVVAKVRGPALFGTPFFDRHPFIMGCLVALDPILDRLPGRFLFSTSLGLLCRKR